MGTFTQEIQGKSAIVTGGGTGIGKAIALGLAKCGVDITITSRNLEHLVGTAKEIEAIGRRCLVIPGDIRKPEDVEKVVTETIYQFGGIDILINNSGGNFECPFVDITPNGWNAVLGINLTGTYLYCKTVGKHMISRNYGNIINIVSISGILGVPLMAHYGAAKAGVINLTKTLAAELGKNNIRVNAIAPGSIVTQSMMDMLGFKTVEEALLKWGKNTSLGHAGVPEDIASLVLFLASEGAKFITGVTIEVDGQIPPPMVKEA